MIHLHLRVTMQAYMTVDCFSDRGYQSLTPLISALPQSLSLLLPPEMIWRKTQLDINEAWS